MALVDDMSDELGIPSHDSWLTKGWKQRRFWYESRALLFFLGNHHVLYFVVHIHKGQAGTGPMPKKHEGCSGAPPHTLLSLNQGKPNGFALCALLKISYGRREGKGLPMDHMIVSWELLTNEDFHLSHTLFTYLWRDFFLTLVTPCSYCLIDEWILFEYVTIICYR